MPLKPFRQCPVSGCSGLTRKRYCEKHQNLDKIKAKEYDKQRDQTEERRWIHSVRWRNLSDLHKRMFPLCAECLKKGRDEPVYLTDHIVPHQGDPTLFWDWDNLQSLCNACHEEKHREDRWGR